MASMNYIKILSLLLLGLTYSNLSLSVDMPDKASDEVVTNLIDHHSELIHSNILSEICGSYAYLEIDYQSKKISELINNEINSVAKRRDLKNYNVAELKDQTQLELQSFLDGSRYGALIAKKYQEVSEGHACSVDILLTIKESQTRFVKIGGYVLKKRLVR
jgi:hypothetical protein